MTEEQLEYRPDGLPLKSFGITLGKNDDFYSNAIGQIFKTYYKDYVGVNSPTYSADNKDYGYWITNNKKVEKEYLSHWQQRPKDIVFFTYDEFKKKFLNDDCTPKVRENYPIF